MWSPASGLQIWITCPGDVVRIVSPAIDVSYFGSPCSTYVWKATWTDSCDDPQVCDAWLTANMTIHCFGCRHSCAACTVNGVMVVVLMKTATLRHIREARAFIPRMKALPTMYLRYTKGPTLSSSSGATIASPNVIFSHLYTTNHCLFGIEEETFCSESVIRNNIVAT